MKRNYQKELETVLARLQGEPPTLLLHACCAPCSSYVLEYLSRYFRITLYFYNPNISPEEEYRRRADEASRLVRELPMRYPAVVREGPYNPARFFEAAQGLENEPEGGVRCEKCFRLRLEEAARAAKEGGFAYFTTTLSISPLKNADLLNAIGGELAETYGVPYLYSDFKKREGYKRSIVLSAEYGLYRQDYCGCVFSKMARQGQE